MFWFGQAAKRGLTSSFVANFARQVRQFESGSNNAAIVFQIGRALNGQIDVEKRTIVGNDYEFDKNLGPANSAISFYKAQLVSCHRAVDTWSYVGIRCGVVKDIRVLICKLVWETRDLALFPINTKWWGK